MKCVCWDLPELIKWWLWWWWCCVGKDLESADSWGGYDFLTAVHTPRRCQGIKSRSAKQPNFYINPFFKVNDYFLCFARVVTIFSCYRFLRKIEPNLCTCILGGGASWYQVNQVHRCNCLTELWQNEGSRYCAPHLSKGTSDLTQKCTEIPKPFSGTAFYALSHDMIGLVLSVITIHHFLIG